MDNKIEVKARNKFDYIVLHAVGVCAFNHLQALINDITKDSKYYIWDNDSNTSHIMIYDSYNEIQYDFYNTDVKINL